MTSFKRMKFLCVFAMILGMIHQVQAQDILFCSNPQSATGTESTSTTLVERGFDQSSSSSPVGDSSAAAALGVPKSTGLITFGEAIYWQAHRQGLDYATFDNPIWLTPSNVASLDLSWQAGIRAGIGYQFGSQWQIGWVYTNYFTKDQGAVRSTDVPNTSLFATRSFLDHTMNAVQAEANLNYNVHDLEISRTVSLEHNVNLRLFGGFRWGMIDQDFRNTYQYRDVLGNTVHGRIENPMSLNGYGIRMGLEGQWCSASGLKLFGRAGSSVLVGNFSGRLCEIDSVDGTIINYSPRFTQAVPGLETAVGASWTRGPWEIGGGYEMSTWFNMGEINRSTNDLLLDGFFVRLSYLW